jgi:hypothetical protein
MRGLTGGNIEFHTIPTEGNAVIGGADVIRVDIAEVRAAIDNLITDTPPAAESTAAATPPASEQALPGANAVTVDLFDGSGSTALGARARGLLRGKGFRIGGGTDLATRASTVLRYAPGDEAGLALVKQALGATIQDEQGNDVTNGHVRVLLGEDFPGAATGSGGQGPAGPSSALPGSPAIGQAITAGGVHCVN